MEQVKVSIQGLNFFYKEKQVFSNFNLDIASNQILALIGPTRSGITTLLRSINRLCELNPDARMEGKIYIDGKNITDKDIELTELRRRVGMVFDVPTPLPMSVFDNVAYGLRVKGVDNKKLISEKVEEALRISAVWDDLKDRLSISALSLSGGQQQRLCIARVLALEPEVVLLDRPCTGLDPISTAKIEDSLINLKEKYTIVIAPHNVQQAGRISDRIAFVLMGELVEEGKNEDIFLQPKDQRTLDYVSGRFG